MSLELIIGPMFAGKSTELIRRANSYVVINRNIFPINHSLNNRYGSTQITTHNNSVLGGCTILSKLSDAEVKNEEAFKQADVILIEELQFFEDAYLTIIDWVENKHKIVIAAGLDGDFKREPIGDVLKLIPFADKVKKMSALCKKCGDGTLAHFSKRITQNSNQIDIGSADTYEAVCRKHYLS